MSEKKLFSSYRWTEAPKATKIRQAPKPPKEEQIKNKETLLKIMVDRKILTQEEADERLNNFKKELN
ncbi:MAG: hypothetical protein HFJ35_02725 [Clostridia bacterium]|nr:hypothetical protein [Clostridia bacterium]